MRRLPLRLMAVALALIGVVVLGGLEQRALRREADRRVAVTVAGYLTMAVPAGPFGDYAADRLLSTVNRLHGSTFWHAGLQVTVGDAAVIDEAIPPPAASRIPLPGPAGRDTVGAVHVWDVALGSGLPGASAILAAATFLVAGLAAGRRAGWLWPLLGVVLLALMLQSVLRETRRVADTVATAALDYAAPMAALLLLDPRLPAASLAGLGPHLSVVERPPQPASDAATWRETPEGRQRVVQMTRGGGAVIELAATAPATWSRALELGLAGAGILLLLAMLPPVVPRRRARAPAGPDSASIRE